MPYKHTIKEYHNNRFYHVFNRGLNNQPIFPDLEDSTNFIGFLKEYLTPPPDRTTLKKSFVLNGQTFQGVPRQPQNYLGKLELVAYCLMPTYYHMIIRPYESTTLPRFMRSLSTRYSMYYNKKQHRQGPVFQSRYKASVIPEDDKMVHLTRYIHRQPIGKTDDLINWYSSFGNFLGTKQDEWVHPQPFWPIYEQYFHGVDYRIWVNDPSVDSEAVLGDLTLQ